MQKRSRVSKNYKSIFTSCVFIPPVGPLWLLRTILQKAYTVVVKSLKSSVLPFLIKKIRNNILSTSLF